ncbi:homocysteine S-methyltransferase family protein [Vallitalea okinawensis]|uniref:homocysteine S-methyltransferase family protein n=1 Tax=Vallitalea okinawensis TaxID=2078660 RepID=UPI000CFB2AE6|nr:homocysteine S-methyltransferase family protein [Vallitalea okinawensis]
MLEQLVLLDGASGTQMQMRGLPKGVCPEKWAVENPEVLIDMQRAYINAGSQIIYTFTFGGNSIKLADYNLESEVYEINKELAILAKKAAGSEALVAGDLAPTGQYIRPVGKLSFEEVVDAYKAQVRGLLDGGVDLFVIETMMDLQEARAAVLAVKESCDLPIMVSMTFEENGRTLTGTDPVSAVITLQSMGVDVVGCNCSTGPDAMLAIINEMKPYAKVPLLVKPNAGLPQLIDGNTVFSMKEEEFADYTRGLVEAGATYVGGCCGTNPSYIKMLKRKLEQVEQIDETRKTGSYLCSSRKTIEIGLDQPITIVGERINPTGKKELQKSLRDGEMTIVKKFALEQKEKGAHVLDVNVGMNGIDEKETMVKAVDALSVGVDLPLCIDSSNPEVIEAALRVYPGRALVNSISNESKKRDRLLKVAAKYGAMILILPISDNGLPKNLDEKHQIINEVYQAATAYGFTKEDVVVDGLVMTVSSAQQAVASTLTTIEWCSKEFGVNTIVGLSNVSFGLPERKWVNASFLAMAAVKGLSMAIANPSSELLMSVKMASDVLTAKDINCKKYVERYSQQTSREEKIVSNNTEGDIYEAVLNGKDKEIKDLIQAALDDGIEPNKIVNELMIPAINEVGQLFDEQVYFLPQLIMSAGAMKEGFSLLEPLLLELNTEIRVKPKIILATVQGDIHDIGKNIVALMFKNHGFEVIDLGKDVKIDHIIEAVKKHQPELLGLSALMTTTMVMMEDVIKALQQDSLKVKVMVGGAVITQSYADEIGADGYSKDANEAIKVAKALLEM